MDTNTGSQKRRRLLVSSALCVALVLAGCYSPRYVSTDQLTKLDSFDAGTEVILVDFGGQEVSFDETAKLALVTSDGLGPAHRYSSIRIRGGEFLGVTQDGQTVLVRMEGVHKAVVSVSDPGKAGFEGAAIVIGSAIAIAVVAAIVIVIIALVGLYNAARTYSNPADDGT